MIAKISKPTACAEPVREPGDRRDESVERAGVAKRRDDRDEHRDGAGEFGDEALLEAANREEDRDPADDEIGPGQGHPRSVAPNACFESADDGRDRFVGDRVGRASRRRAAASRERRAISSRRRSARRDIRRRSPRCARRRARARRSSTSPAATSVSTHDREIAFDGREARRRDERRDRALAASASMSMLRGDDVVVDVVGAQQARIDDADVRRRARRRSRGRRVLPGCRRTRRRAFDVGVAAGQRAHARRARRRAARRTACCATRVRRRARVAATIVRDVAFGRLAAAPSAKTWPISNVRYGRRRSRATIARCACSIA